MQQKFTITCGGHSHTITKKLIEKNVAGPKAGEAKWTHEMTLNFDQIMYQVTREKKKKGQSKAISQEDQYMMAGLQAATRGNKIANLYTLKLEVDFDVGECCGEGDF